MSDTTTITQHLIEKILKEHDSRPEINCVLTQNYAFQYERESSKISLVRLQNALKAMPKIIDEQGHARRPTSSGWVLKANKQFIKHTGHSVDEIDNTEPFACKTAHSTTQRSSRDFGICQ